MTTMKYMQLRNRKLDMKRWKGKFTGRKGMGMELALLVLLVVFGCSTLLVSSAMIGKSNLDRQEERLTQRTELDRIAEEFLAAKVQFSKNELGVYVSSWPDEDTELCGYRPAIYLWDETSTEEDKWSAIIDNWVENYLASAGETPPEGEAAPTVQAPKVMLCLLAAQSSDVLLTVVVENGVVTEWTYH